MVLSQVGKDPKANVRLEEVGIQFKALVVILCRLVQFPEMFQTLPHVAIGARLGDVKAQSFFVDFQGVPKVLHGRQRFGLLVVGWGKAVFDEDGVVVRLHSFFQFAQTLPRIAQVVPRGKTVGKVVDVGQVKGLRLLNAPFFVVAKGQFVQCRLVAWVFPQGVVKDADGLFPLPKVLMLEGNVDEKFLLQLGV